ncbi:MAG: polyprenyl synthetase family protein [Bacteroidota bacterium]|nr:polyprenyl synthetase family protein [Candidatus Kapabacteria bacterium]MCX7937368.1 polyprenyl synthetase family protein [Chlorobiota bacterium]MDW8075855.1 polyprenyl synthetase family protein [Bacteroidota bacterium]MDW8271825.1 polyprenyl synthetase family protein [Bacteroidota bacterium]
MTHQPTFAQPIAAELEQFNRYFAQQMRSSVPLLTLAVRYVLRSRGKQLRPILVFLSAGAAGGITERSYVGAAMVELLHTATLIHDDVVDNAPLRRGLASINAVWKNKVAVLVGDFLLARGLLLAVEHNEFDFLRVTATAVRRMSEGELLQIQTFRKRRFNEETYLRIVRDKTASLIATCCQIGAISAGADDDTCTLFAHFGECIGTAFQIRDDVLDYTSRTTLLGKPTAHDLREGKITLPLLRALAQAPSDQAASIRRLLASPLRNRSIERIVSFVETYGGTNSAMETARALVQEGTSLLGQLPPSPYRAMLEAFARYTIERTK